MTIITEETIRPDETSEPLSIKDRLLSLQDAQVATIGTVLGVSGAAISKHLKVLWINNFSEKMEGNKRLITLTSNGVEKLLKMSATEVSQHKPVEKTHNVVTPTVGVSFSAFEKQLRALGHVKSTKSLWDALIKNHREFFVISYKDSVCFYQVNPIYIEQALSVAQRYRKEFDTKVKKGTSTDRRPLWKKRVNFLSNIG